MAERQRTAHPAPSVTGAMARALAARLAEHGYQVTFPVGRDSAVFKLTGLPGHPDVEVTAEESGSAACHYTGGGLVEAAAVIARLPVPGHPAAQAAAGDTMIATWGGIEIEWHYMSSPGQPADVGQVATALVAPVRARRLVWRTRCCADRRGEGGWPWLSR